MFVIEENGHPIFASERDHLLVPSVQASYDRSWKAYKDATAMIGKKRHHLSILKAAIEDMVEPIKIDISGEEMIENHYREFLKNVKLKARGTFEEEEEKELAYAEVKMIVGEMDTLLQTVEDSNAKKQLTRIQNSFKKVIRQHYPKYKAKDDAQEAEQAAMQAAMPPAMPPTMPPAPDPMAAPPAPAMASRKTHRIASSIDLKDELLDEYASKACEAVSSHHNVVFQSCPKTGHAVIYTLDDGLKEPILVLSMNEYLNINSIMPHDNLRSKCPFHSLEFYQRYWKPIVESIGHFFVDEADVLILTSRTRLPDITAKTPSTQTLKGWSPKSSKEKNIDVSFKGEKDPIWILEASYSDNSSQIKSAESKYTEQDYMNAIIKCIDPDLKSIYGRTGGVVQVLPLVNQVEVDVDFGRGIGIVRLDESKIEIIPIEV